MLPEIAFSICYVLSFTFFLGFTRDHGDMWDFPPSPVAVAIVLTFIWPLVLAFHLGRVTYIWWKKPAEQDY